MTQREREPLAPGWSGDDPHALLFDDDDAGDYRETRADRRRADHHRRTRRRRRGRLFVLLAVLIVAAVAYFVVPRVVDYFSVADYSGQGTTPVRVTIQPGSVQDTANSLQKAGVVESAQAFVDACSGHPCESIRPGVYNMRVHMSGAAAVALILDPTSRSASNDLVIPEGATSLDVEARLVKIYGTGQKAAIDKALKDPADLGLPRGYTGKGDGIPHSVEGFLFPATYTINPGQSPATVLGDQLVPRYLQQDRQTGFADAAAKLHVTPYDALIMASIAQSEAKYASDMPKVVRTIMNRIKVGRALQFDSTSSYGCKLAGTPANKCIYKDVNSPYNTYLHKGLPPTPIDNPGAPAMAAAVAPAKGDWLYFVNKDAAGHLTFTSNEKTFEADVARCVKYHWGCG